MSVSTSVSTASKRPERERSLPVLALVLMAFSGFIIIMTETLPAGLLPQLADEFQVSNGTAGQLITAYALGTVLAAIPTIAMTRSASRKPLLIIGLLGFFVANTLMAIAPTLVIALVVRFIAGAFSGLIWGMLAGYARRIAAPEHAGRALAIAMAGTPVALSIGTPLGAWLGSTIGWRWSFAGVSALTVVVVLLVLACVPNAPGQPSDTRLPLGRVLIIPGVALILGVVFAWMLAHNLLYTYIAPYLDGAGVGLRPDVTLFVFGVAALVGIWITGTLIDRSLRRLTLVSTAAFIVAGCSCSFSRLHYRRRSSPSCSGGSHSAALRHNCRRRSATRPARASTLPTRCLRPRSTSPSLAVGRLARSWSMAAARQSSPSL